MKIKGKNDMKIIGNSIKFNNNDLWKILKELKELESYYGKIVRFWIGNILIVVIKDEDDIKNVVKNDKLCKRGYMIRKEMENKLRNGMIKIDGEGWIRNRRIVYEDFNKNIFEKFVKNLEKNRDILEDKLKDIDEGINDNEIDN